MTKNVEFVIADVSFGHFSKKLEEMIEVEAKKRKMLAWKEATLSEVIDKGDAVFALVDCGMVGFVCLTLYIQYVEICALIVVSEHRNKKIGSSLMEKAISLAKEKYPDKAIILLSNTISFYMGEKFGFTVVEKSIFDNEIWESCVFCREYKNFPQCHCRPMMLVP